MLIVDDTATNVDILVEAIGDIYDIYVALDGGTAMEMIEKEPPDLILLDVMMPGMNGFEVCKKLKADSKTKNIPVIFLTALSEVSNKTEGFALGAVDYIQKPFEIVEVKARIKTHVMLRNASRALERQNETLEEMVEGRTREIALTQEATIEALANLAEYRDPETGEHIRRTQNYVKTMALKLKEHKRFSDYLDDRSIKLLTASAPLHDIGKVALSDSILLKKGPLSSEETAIMQKHTTYGHDTILTAEKRLGTNSFLSFAREIAISHHEKWDGSGYPNGLKGDAIPVPGRIMAIADVYDALTSKRVYKSPISHSEAIRIIAEGDGRTKPEHFDPDVLEVFLESEGELREIAMQFIDSGEEREVLLK